MHSARCTLHDQTGAILSGGHGKGSADSSLVGAMFEAPEHYWNRFDATDQTRLVYLSAKEFVRDNLRLSQHLPLSLVEESDNKNLPFRQYEGITRSVACLYPFGLATPPYIDGLRSGAVQNSRDEYDYRYLARYSSNCGVAIGANRTESVIHGLLECVEADALSHFLADVFLVRRSGEPAVVDRASLPSNLSGLARRIEKESSRKVPIFELKNRFNIPAFLTVLHTDPSCSIVYGCGASLSRHHALSRSLHEAAQMQLIKTAYSWAADFDSLVVRRLEHHPLHLHCVTFEFPDRYFKNEIASISYEETASMEYPTNIDKYPTRIGSILVSHEAAAYTTEIKRFENGINLSHSFFEGQDHFSLVTSGNVVFSQPATVGLNK